MTKERVPEEVSTDIQNLNEVYDAKFEELREARQKLDREYWTRLEELNQEWEQLIKQRYGKGD